MTNHLSTGPSSTPHPPHLILSTSSSIPNTSALRATSTIFHFHPSQVAYQMAPARPLKTTKCENCGKSVLSANYARHVKKAYPGVVINRVRKLKQFKYLEIVESCRPGEPISYEEYLRTDWTDHANNPELRYKYVICSQEEARIILENGYLAVPLVILPVFSKDFPIRDIDDYLDFLATKPRIDVHITIVCRRKRVRMKPKRRVRARAETARTRRGKPSSSQNQCSQQMQSACFAVGKGALSTS
jgi:hypothetical protein